MPQFGLLRGSFRPREAVVQLRAYLRLRERLIEYAEKIQHTLVPGPTFNFHGHPQFQETGQGYAAAVLLLLIILALTAISFWVLSDRRRERA